MRFPSRAQLEDALARRGAQGRIDVRSTKGLATRTPRSGWPATREAIAST